MRRLALLLILIILAGGGCARGIGAKRLPLDRTAYIEALGNSWKDQILYNIVKLRYGDAPTLLDVSSITQAYDLEVGVTPKYTHGWGRNAPTSTGGVWLPGNLTNSFESPVAFTYKSQPTVTYNPIGGEELKQSLIAPIPMNDLFKALETGWDPRFILPYCIQSINNLQNNSDESLDLGKLANLWSELRKKQAIHITFEDVKEAKEIENRMKPEGKSKGQKDWDKAATNLAKFTSTLVEKQKEGEGKGDKVPFVILDTKKAENEIKEFKKLLHLNSDATNEKNDLKKKARALLIDNPHKFDNLRKFLDIKDSDNIDNDKIMEVMGLPKELTSFEQEKIKDLADGKPIEKYQVIYGIAPGETNLTKIYVKPRSVMKVLMVLAQLITVPSSHAYHENLPSKINMSEAWSKPPILQWYPDIDRFEVLFRPDRPLPDIAERPKQVFAAVKYKGYWFYIRDNDLASKDILSSMIAIFTMMPTGKKEAPQLTLPVR